MLNFLIKKNKPNILLLADVPNWAYDFKAKAISKYLGAYYNFKIRYAVKKPNLAKEKFDLIYIFFWAETYYRNFNIPKHKIAKWIGSHRWQNEKCYGFLTPKQMADKYLYDVGYVATISKLLRDIFIPYRKVFLLPDGYLKERFYYKRERRGELLIGWAGNIKDSCKGVKDIVMPACDGKHRLIVADGKLPHKKMVDFYNKIDVLCISSLAEGAPQTLVEGMASGCFPVCTNVGIVPELVKSGKNGLIIERSVQAFEDAFVWCEKNINLVRAAGRLNAEVIAKKRSWEIVIKNYKNFFDYIFSTPGQG